MYDMKKGADISNLSRTNIRDLLNSISRSDDNNEHNCDITKTPRNATMIDLQNLLLSMIFKEMRYNMRTACHAAPGRTAYIRQALVTDGSPAEKHSDCIKLGATRLKIIGEAYILFSQTSNIQTPYLGITINQLSNLLLPAGEHCSSLSEPLILELFDSLRPINRPLKSVQGYDYYILPPYEINGIDSLSTQGNDCSILGTILITSDGTTKLLTTNAPEFLSALVPP